MSLTDSSFIFQWWLVFFIIGIFFIPLSTKIFSSFLDAGYIFSKTLAIAIGSYLIFILGILHISKFTQINTIIIFTLLGIINYFFINKNFISVIKDKWRIVFLEEAFFLAVLTFWSFIRANQPEIHGLEKYMDFGFVNSILRADYLPPKDMWFTPFPINYYYFGHLITAVLTKLSGMPSSVTYNLMLSTIAAFTFTSAFSIGANLVYLAKSQITNHKSQINSKSQKIKKGSFESFENWNLKIGIFIGGFLTAILLTFAGNLHAIYTFFKPYVNENPVPFWQLPFSPNTFPNSYWYPNATRFIHNTIHEFPIYSFVVSDLHGHVLDIPFVLLTIALLLSLFLKSQITNHKSQINQNIKISKQINFWNFENWNLFRNWKLLTLQNGEIRNLLLISFLLAVMYMTNAWDGIIYFILTSLVLLLITFKKSSPLNEEIKNQKSKIKNTIQNSKISNYIFLVLGLGFGFILFSLPFSIHFKPFVSGIGILCAPPFLTNIGKLGPFLFEADHCQRSPLWQLLILYGFFYFWIISFILFIRSELYAKRYTLNASDFFILILILISTLLIIIPEFTYIKDIYPAHYRANTMFKLVYQSFIMLSIVSGYIISKIVFSINKKILNACCLIPTAFLFFLVLVYPYFAVNSYYGNLQAYRGLDGTAYLANLYPSDYQAILWINANIKGQPVILEAQGDSYTDYARVSANTGLPTVLGWTVHEWLWRGTYDIPAPRIIEVSNLYESKDLNLTKQLIKKYKISLVFIGDLERQKYPKLYEDKFGNFGEIIYKNGNTRIYRLSV